MTLLHCLACDDLLAMDEGASAAMCACARSVADLSDGEIHVHGPCRVVWIGESNVVTTVVGSSEWPTDAPRVLRRPVPPLL
jgi:hypothetical protein